MNDDELYRRGTETLLASWEAIARGSRGARVIRGEGFAAAVFPHPPERAVYNNALLEPGASLEALEEAYAGIDGFAAWVHEADRARSVSCSPAAKASSRRPRSASAATATAGSSTSRPSSARAGAASAAP